MIIKRIFNLRNQTFLTKTNFFSFMNSKFDSKKDYYSMLGVDKKATESQIKQAYYRLAKQNHPDANKGKQQKFKEINEAHSILSDPQLRKEYDQSRVFGEFTRKFTRGRRSSNSNAFYQFNQADFNFKNNYQQFTEEQRQQLRHQLRILALRTFVISFALFFFAYMFFRRPATHYFIDPNGHLIPYVHFHNIPPMMDPYGNPIHTAPQQLTRNSNPYHLNSQYNQYNPYNANYTSNPYQSNYTVVPPSNYPSGGSDVSSRLQQELSKRRM